MKKSVSISISSGSRALLEEVTRWAKLSRWRDWLMSKLPFAAAAALLAGPADLTLGSFVGVLCAVSCCAAFGYGVNEIADRRCDLLAGKANRAATISASSRLIFVAAAGLGTLVSGRLYGDDWSAVAVWAVALSLAAGYSCQPLRLKERGAIGLWSAALAQWSLPVIAVAAVGWTDLQSAAPWSVAALGAAIGARWMAVHQYLDLAADRRAGVTTFAARGGSVARLIRWAFASEIVLLAMALVLCWPRSIFPAAALAVWILYAGGATLLHRHLLARLHGFAQAPLAEYYFLLLPLSLVAGRSLSSPAFLCLLPLFVATGWGYLLAMAGETSDSVKLWASRQ